MAAQQGNTLWKCDHDLIKQSSKSKTRLWPSDGDEEKSCNLIKAPEFSNMILNNWQYYIIKQKRL